MKRKATSSGGLATKKAKTSGTSKYDTKTGRWIVAGPRLSAAAAAAVRGQVMEKKRMDTNVSLALGSVLDTTNTNGAAFVLNLIQTGTGSWNRVGRKTQLKSVRVKGTVTSFANINTTTGDINCSQMRMVLVWDKQPSGAAIPAFDQIFGITDQNGAESCPNIFCPPRFDNMDRFRILRDTIVDLDVGVLGAGGTTNGYINQVQVDEYVKLPDLESVYSGQSSPMTIADISTGALYVYFRALSNSASSGSRVAVIGQARIRYTD